MENQNKSEPSPSNVLLKFIEDRIQSCERKRRRNLFFMNFLKLIRIISGTLAVLLVSLLASDGIPNEVNFLLNIGAILCTAVTALGSEILDSFGFQTRFKQNVQSSANLRTLKFKFELARSMSQSDAELDYVGFHDQVVKILQGQAKDFDLEFEKHKEKK